MDNLVTYKFMEELRQQCRFGWLAYQQLKTSLNAMDSQLVFLHTHSLLFHARNISRILWPERSSSEERGRILREALEVKDGSVLHLRGLTAHLERPDESYEDWLTALADPNYVDMNVMATEALGDIRPDAFHRSLDPDTFKMQWRGASCDVKLLAEEARRLDGTIENWMKTHKAW